MKEEIFLMFIGLSVVTTASILIYLILKLVHINRWIISFPLASLICYCIFCTWFVGNPFPIHLEGHDFGIICFLGRPISLLTIFLLKLHWFDFDLQIIDMMLPLLIAFQYLLIGWLIDKIVKKVNKRKDVKGFAI